MDIYDCVVGMYMYPCKHVYSIEVMYIELCVPLLLDMWLDPTMKPLQIYL